MTPCSRFILLATLVVVVVVSLATAAPEPGFVRGYSRGYSRPAVAVVQPYHRPNPYLQGQFIRGSPGGVFFNSPEVFGTGDFSLEFGHGGHRRVYG
ncbi:hypothetical protein Hamer_G009330 [Homarus americanus]|uniref:Secreted protein n=1 Tax=Homarus americanus TaxID=6706 RepID=A0A8J5J9U4_HOMAM|nr:hypothetical protein Hamer_G009330 [Homarus americanus]